MKSQFYLDLIVFIICFSIILQYYWSMNHHFKSGIINRNIKILMVGVGVTTTVFTYLLWSREQPSYSLLFSMLVILVSDVLFWLAVQAASIAFPMVTSERDA